MSSWLSENTLGSSQITETASSNVVQVTEECSICHKTIQSGRFCSECNAKVLTEENSKETSEISEVDYSSIKQSWKSDDKTSLPSFHWGDVPSDTVYSGSFGEYSLSHPFVFGQQQSRSTHRFSLDVGEEEFLANNGNQPGEVYSSSLNSSYVPFTSSVYSSRRRASTAGVLPLGSSLTAPEDALASNVPYDIDPYESSTEPMFSHSLAVDPLPSELHDPLSLSHGVGGHDSLLSSHLDPYSLMDLSDGTEDISLLPSLNSVRTGRSLSEVDISLPESLDYGMSGGVGSYLSRGSLSSSVGSKTETFDSLHPSLRRNSVSSLPQLNPLTEDHLFSLSPVRSPSLQPLVKGSLSYSTNRSSLLQSFSNGSTLQSEIVLKSESNLTQSSPQRSSSPITGFFDASELKKWHEFEVFRGRIVEMVCTQNGSKSLQNFLHSSMSEKVRTSVIDSIVMELAPTGSRIICDTFGNYFYQLLFKKASEEQKETLLRSLLHEEGCSTVYEISVNKTGTFAFQNIIDFMAGQRVLGDMIVSALQNSRVNGKTEDVTLRLIKENKGTHIIQRIMKTFGVDQWTSIYTILLENCHSVAMDRNGSMVLRLCYDLVDIDRKAQIANDIIAHARELAVDPVGNYVVQHVLCIPKTAPETEVERYKSFVRGVLSHLQKHYVELSKQKYSSNVVEKSIANSVLLDDRAIFDELLAIPAILQLLDNHFGTYVLQKTLQSLQVVELKKVDVEVRSSKLVNGGHGVSLLNKWKQIVNRST